MRLLLPGLLGGLALALGAATAYEALMPVDPVVVEIPHVPPRPPRLVRPAPYVPPPEERFAEIDARPLFSSSRQPLQDPALTGAAVATSDFVLTGVILGGAHSIALIKSRSTSQSISAAVGDVVNGWRVTAIDAESVKLKSSSGEFVVPLDGPSNQPPSAPLQPVATGGTTPSSPPPLPASPPPSPPAQAVRPVATAAPPPPTPTVRPRLPARHDDGTIDPEALKGAPIDPQTGEPTL